MATTIPCKIHIPLRLPRPLNPTNPPASKTARPANCQLLVGRAGPSTYPPLLSLKSAAAARPNLHSPNSWPAVQCNEGFCNASEGQRLPLTTAMASQKPHHSATSRAQLSGRVFGPRVAYWALLGSREMFDLSPQSGPKRTLSPHHRMTESDPIRTLARLGQRQRPPIENDSGQLQRSCRDPE